MRPGLSAGSDKNKIIFTAEHAENAEKFMLKTADEKSSDFNEVVIASNITVTKSVHGIFRFTLSLIWFLSQRSLRTLR